MVKRGLPRSRVFRRRHLGRRVTAVTCLRWPTVTGPHISDQTVRNRLHNIVQPGGRLRENTWIGKFAIGALCFSRMKVVQLGALCFSRMKVVQLKWIRRTRKGLGLYSLSGKTSYRQISWSLEAARLDVVMVVSLWNLTGTSAAALPRYLPKFREIGKV